MFRHDHPVAWAYHRQTSRWPFNMHDLNMPLRDTPPFKEDVNAATIELPDPVPPRCELADAIAQRVSCRAFLDQPIALDQLGTILHYGYGVLGTIDLWGEFCERPVPSGGGLYPLEVYVLAQRVEHLTGGAYHYTPLTHQLEVVRTHPIPRLLSAEMFLGQPYLTDAAAVIVLTAMVERSMWKYEDRGYRYLMLEAGHVAQNVNLCSTALGLGSLNLGGFFDEDVAALLQIDLDVEIPLYGIAVGRRRSQERIETRRASEADAAFRRF